MAARALDAIECSVQPLDFAFHPSKDIIATALVDGTVECKIACTFLMTTVSIG